MVRITVTRNLNAPEFVTNSLRVNIPDNSAPGTMVAQVEARDKDREVKLTINFMNRYNGA